MNLSGLAVRYWMQKENIPLENVLIVVDDLALPFGTLRLKGKGHEQLVQLLRDKALQPLSDALSHHFEHIVASLCFERSGVTLPDFARLFAGYKEP